MHILSRPFSLLFIALIITLWPVQTEAQRLSAQQSKNDLNALIKSIETFNPTLNIYNQIFRKEADLIVASVKTELSLIEHFALISRICALSNEGHYKLGSVQDTLWKGFYNDSYHYLPFSIEVIHDRFYIKQNFSDNPAIKRYDEILTINGKSAPGILMGLYKCVPTDGQITSYADKKISSGFQWMYYFYFEQTESFSITIRPQQGIPKVYNIRALTRSQQASNFKARYPSNNKVDASETSIEEFYTLDFNERYALLTLKSFDRGLAEKHKIKAKKFYKQIFQTLKDSSVYNLIIDLRNNTGGRKEFANEIVPFILQTSGDEFLQKSISWKGKEKTYKMPRANKKLVFKGHIYVLTNGYTYSNGSTLARYLKEFANATVIGTETGTRYEGFAAGSTQYVELPESKLVIGIPRYHITFPKSKKQFTRNQGLLPAIEIHPTWLDWKNGKDIILKTAIQHIK